MVVFRIGDWYFMKKFQIFFNFIKAATTTNGLVAIVQLLDQFRRQQIWNTKIAYTLKNGTDNILLKTG